MRYLTLLVLLLVSCAGTPKVEQNDRLEPYSEVFRLEDFQGYGSGFPAACVKVGEVYRVAIVTASHVGPGPFEVCDSNGVLVGETYHWEVAPDGVDLGVAWMWSHDYVQPRRLGFEFPASGTLVTAAGYPYGHGSHWISVGATSPPDRMGLWIAPGMSGGPVSLMDGAVIGVVRACAHRVHSLSGSRETMHNMSYYTPLGDAADWLREVLTEGATEVVAY